MQTFQKIQVQYLKIIYKLIYIIFNEIDDVW